MCRRGFALLFFILLTTVPVLAGDFSATTWDEALALSSQHDKPILIDFFTEW